MTTSQMQQVSATGDVTTRDAFLRSVTLTAGSDAATLTVKAGGASGTTVLTVKAAAGTTAVVTDVHDALCADGIHATLAGTGPVASIVYV